MIIFLSKTTETISINLDTKHSWVTWIQHFRGKAQIPFTKRNKNELVEIHWLNLIIFWRNTGLISNEFYANCSDVAIGYSVFLECGKLIIRILVVWKSTAKARIFRTANVWFNPSYYKWFSFSGCPDGLYGYNCAFKCSLDCEDPANCDKITGNCYGIYSFL